MALSVEKQLQYWGIALLLLFVFLWFFSSVIFPFIVGMAVAYCMDPIADWLERKGFSRLWATISITAVFVVCCILAIALLVPAIVQQASDLAAVLPTYVEQGRVFLLERFPSLMDENSPLRQNIEQFMTQLQEQFGSLVSAVLTSAFGAVNVVIAAIIIPIVTFYMLMDWDRLVAQIDDALPRDHQETIRELARDVDKAMAGFIRGQLSVMAILGVFYAVALVVAGLNGGLVIGLVAGLLTFIPYVGALIGGVLSIGVALFQYWGADVAMTEYALRVGIIAAIFFFGQFMEGNFITPNLVGSSVGLHPVWLLFALSAFGAVMGFTGLLIAVPVAAIIAVFVRFGLERYRHSKLYLGASSVDQDDTTTGL